MTINTTQEAGLELNPVRGETGPQGDSYVNVEATAIDAPGIPGPDGVKGPDAVEIPETDGVVAGHDLTPSIRASYRALAQPSAAEIARASKWFHSLPEDAKLETMKVAKPKDTAHLAKYWVWIGKPAPIGEVASLESSAGGTQVDVDLTTKVRPTDQGLEYWRSGSDQFADTVGPSEEELEVAELDRAERELRILKSEPNWSISFKTFLELFGFPEQGSKNDFSLKSGPPIVIAILILTLALVLYKVFM